MEQSHSSRKPQQLRHEVCELQRFTDGYKANCDQQSLGREESWENVKVRGNSNSKQSMANLLQSQSDGDDALSIPGSSFSFDSRTLHTLFPLQSVANRVTAQVEEFAIQVDEWMLERDTTRDLGAKHAQTIHLLEALQEIIGENVTSLKTKLIGSGKTQISKTWQGRIKELKDKAASTSQELIESTAYGGSLKDDIADDLHKARSEACTWDLLRRLIDLHFPDPTVDVEQGKKDFLAMRGEITDETPNSEIWERFILTDDAAREKNIVLKWLEDCAATDDSELDEIIDKLETVAGTDRGTWTHGWLNTREKLKAQKRMNLVTAPLKSSVLTVRGTDELVTQLDPDAVSRQEKNLEKVDDIYERSLWVACFALLRRGVPWADVREYAQHRSEAWRAASFGMTPTERDARTCLAGPYVGTLWRRMCFAAARRPGAYDYEKAIYGLLSGDSESVEPVSRSWDDNLYASFNALLIASFEEYLQQVCPERIPSTILQKFSQPNRVSWSSNKQEVMERIGRQPASRAEARTCTKLVQSSLLSQTFPKFVRDVGIAMSRDANAAGPTPLIPITNANPSEDHSKLLADFDAIRLIVHVLIIYQALSGPIFADSAADRVLVENVFVWYLNYLRIIHKIEAIPTYARFVGQPRREEVVGVIMVDIVETSEQRRLVSLMKGSSLHIPRVMAAQLEFAMARMGLDPGAFAPVDRVDMLEPTDNPLWPGVRVRKDFAPAALSDAEERLVRAAEWFLHIRSQWQATFEALTMVLKAFLLAGRWGAAVAFTRQIPFADVSRLKSAPELGRAVDVFHDADPDPEPEPAPVDEPVLRRTTRASSRQPSAPPAPPPPQPRAPDPRARMVRDILRAQSRACLELQQLAGALAAVSGWRAVEAQAAGRGRGDARAEKALRGELADLAAAVDPLLRPGFLAAADGEFRLLRAKRPFVLTWPRVEDELPDYARLLQVYVPAALTAYASARAFAAAFLGPEALLPALELANVVADDANEELQAAFIAAGRMAEFVDVLARASRCLLVANQDAERQDKVARGLAADGKKRRKVVRKKSGLKKRGWMGETPDIWDPTKLV